MSVRPDIFTYHTVEALHALSLAEVEALWELVPTDRQRLYRAAYDRTCRDEGASGSDALEEAMLTQLLERYNEKGLVPVGAYWVPTPPQLQDAAKSDTDWLPSPAPTGALPKRSPFILGAGAICIALFLFLFVHRVTSKSSASLSGTLTRTPTATLARTYTPTPLALDSQDTIIRGGSAGSSGTIMYPVNLRVSLSDVPQPRLFVVQRRVVNTAEWTYDDNPDVVSYLVGFVAHPILGIPYSDANAELFRQAAPGSVFTLQMNTGAVQRFVCTGQRTIGRGDTTYFAQNRPGLTLVLMGDQTLDPQSATDQRLLLLADYAPAQDELLSNILPTIAAPTPTLTLTPVQRVDVQIVGVTKQASTLTVRLRVFNGQTEPLILDRQSVWLTYGYSERPVGPHIAAAIQPISIAPAQAADVILVFAWHGEPFAMLNVIDEYQYALTL